MYEYEIIEKLKGVGLLINSLSRIKNKWVAVPTYDKPTNKNGRYLIHDEGVVFWKIWHLETKGVINLNNIKNKDLKSIIEKQKIIDEKEKIKKYEKFKLISYLINNENFQEYVYDHAYIKKKKIKELKNDVISYKPLNNNISLLYIPLYHQKNDKMLISGYQTIKFDGSKSFLTGTMLNGSFYSFYNCKRDKADYFLLCEGFATGYSIYMALKELYNIIVLCCFSCNNISNVKNTFIKYNPIVVCDNDEAGINSAQGKKILGDIRKNKDASDYYLDFGIEELSRYLIKELKNVGYSVHKN